MIVDFKTRTEQPKPILNYQKSAIDLRPKPNWIHTAEPNWIKPCGSKTHFDIQEGYVDDTVRERKHLLAKATAFMKEPKPIRGQDDKKLRRTEKCFGFRPLDLLKWPIPEESANSKKLFPNSRSEMQLNQTRPYSDYDRQNLKPLYYRKKQDQNSRFNQQNSRPETANVTFLQEEMNRKIRVQSSYALRNGIPEKIPGEKAYRKPECSNAFFKEPGLITGSSAFLKPRNYRKNAVVDFEEEKNTKWHKRPRAIYANFLKTQHKKIEKEEVFEDLDKWEKTVLKEARPDYRDPDDDDWFFGKTEPEVEDTKGKKAPPPKKKAGKK